MIRIRLGQYQRLQNRISEQPELTEIDAVHEKALRSSEEGSVTEIGVRRMRDLLELPVGQGRSVGHNCPPFNKPYLAGRGTMAPSDHLCF